GSSSLKLRLLGETDAVEAAHDLERWDGAEEASEVSAWLAALPAFDGVGHRVVHGGNEFREAVPIDADVEGALLALASLARLHQPRAVAAIRMIARLRPELPQVACF